MNQIKRAVVAIYLGQALLKRESWCGETHLQKGTFFLQELLGMKTNYDFILYKFGPFSFEYRDDLTWMQAANYFRLQISSPYGPRLLPTEQGISLAAGYPEKMRSAWEPRINSVADFFGGRGVSDLERIATAYYVTKYYPEQDEVETLTNLKPHIDKAQAKAAFQEVREFIQKNEHLVLA